MSYTVSRDFSAPAEVVFGTATDLGRWGRYLPSGVQIERQGTDGLKIAWSGGEQLMRWQVAAEEMRVTARPADITGGPQWSGLLEVVETPAGGSTARVEIDGDDGRLRAAAEQALAHLDGEVSDELSAG